MPLVSMKRILGDARAQGYAVGGFDAWNLESARAILEAAESTGSPVVILTGPYGLGRTASDIRCFSGMVRALAEDLTVPVAMLLNEAISFDLVIQAVRHGFTDVMLETSSLPLHENIAQTRRVVEIAHSAGLGVEAQLGEMPLSEDLGGRAQGKAFRTDPREAASFVNETGVDALAVSFGNVHVLGQGTAELDLSHFDEIARAVDVPLVVHGGTSISDKAISTVISRGACKINVGTKLRDSFVAGIEKALARGPSGNSLQRYVYVEEVLEAGRQAVQSVVAEKMAVYGSAGKAAGV